MKEYPMKTILITKPQKKPVELAAVKDHLRVAASDSSSDHLILQLIQSAIERVEDETGRALITQTWDLVFDSWSELIWKDKLCGIERILPFGNCQSVNSIKYQDVDNQTQTVSVDQYKVSGAGTDEAKIVFPSGDGFEYPVLYEVDPITVRITVGYGDDQSKIPMQIQTAIKIIVSDLFDDEDHEAAINSALKSHKLWSF